MCKMVMKRDYQVSSQTNPTKSESEMLQAFQNADHHGCRERSTGGLCSRAEQSHMPERAM
jgi:hypothetical protein